MSLSSHHAHALVDVPEQVRTTKEVAMRFRRRVLHPRRIAAYETGTRPFRLFKVSAFVGLAGVMSYMALFSDFGQNEHCFTPLRKQYDNIRKRVLTLSEDDIKEVEARRAANQSS
ncbi:hypothetical protein HDU79_003764 [Rhizoclosmatium sp. JEL0117]|nr:hypothetical protein HDU79_003764 [Rhizoclosmatium sp. JEL0117]